jgi:hypothetical protein
MTVPQFPGLDPRRSRLRATVATIDGAISRLPMAERPRLVEAWADLVDQLALGPEPEVRQCPECHHTCMREATRCGHCFALLAPPPDRPSSSATA